MAKQKKKRKVFKSSDTGKFVTEKFAKKNPKTTYQTFVRIATKKKKKK